MNIGIIFALVALVAWAFDDLFIGKVSKKLGSMGALLFLCVFGTIVLFPFVASTVFTTPSVLWSGATGWVLLALVGVTLIAALADFEALRIGKLSTIDPLYGFEIPITVLLGYITIKETLGGWELSLIGLIVLGMFLVSIRPIRSLATLKWEKGVHLALVSILFMGGTNFLTGYGARITDPIVVNWVSYLGMGLCIGVYMAITRKLRGLGKVIVQHKRLLILFGIADVVAWTSFAKSASLIPIGIATAISEAYIGLAVLLGLYINKEKLKKHQFIGIVIILVAVTTLAYMSD